METLLALTRLALNAGNLTMNDGLNDFYFAALALVLAFVVARSIKRRHGSSAESSWPAGSTNDGAVGQILETQRILTQKNCPNCNEQLPLSALICAACDYNFLAARPGRGLKALPAPEPMTPRPSAPRIATAKR
jgi:Uncharacterised protein family UPF0547